MVAPSHGRVSRACIFIGVPWSPIGCVKETPYWPIILTQHEHFWFFQAVNENRFGLHEVKDE